MSQLGHNNPPEESGLVERLKDDYADLCADMESATHHLRQITSELNTEHQNAQATDAIRDFNKAEKALEKAREAEKAPFLQSCREVDGFFKHMPRQGAEAKSRVEGLVSQYLRKKEAAERAEREAEERAAKEAAAKAAEEAEKARRAAVLADANRRAKADEEAAKAEHEQFLAQQEAEQAQQRATEKPAELARSRTASGGLSTLKKVTHFTIDDLEKVPLEALRPYLTRADIEKAIKKFIAAGRRDLDGVTITETTTAAIR